MDKSSLGRKISFSIQKAEERCFCWV